MVGPTLFNSLPYHIRNLSGCSIETFKTHLDNYLSGIPDNPIVTGGNLPPPLDQFNLKNSNSIKDWTHYLNLRNRRPVYDPNNFIGLVLFLY